MTKLLGLDHEIIYTPGRSNVVADVLSRIFDQLEAMFEGVSMCQPLLIGQLQDFYASNPASAALLSKFATSATTPFSIQQGLLYYQDRLFIPLETGLHQQLILEHHSTPQGGHSGNKGTLTKLTAIFSWP